MTADPWDWPNAAGFQAIHEQKDPIELRITGEFPAATAGVLLRTGPATRSEGDFHLSHWFDGFSQVYRFQILVQPDGTSCKVVYNSRRQVDAMLKRVRETGRLDEITFGQRDPCKSFFGKLKQTFAKTQASGTPDDANVAVTIHSAAKISDNKLETRTDSAELKHLDMETLEPVGLTNQSSLHPELTGPLSCAHAQFDPVSGDCFNYNLDFGRFPTYRVFKTSAKTGETEILAKITGADIPPAYLHSFWLTENYVVLAIWTARFQTAGLKMLWERNLLDSIAPFDPKAKCLWFVIDRKHGKGVVKRFSSPAMFAFHTINAYEETTADGKVDIFADVVEYPSLDVLHRLYYDNLVSDSAGATSYFKNGQRAESTQPRLTRYKLANITATSSSNGKKDAIGEAERILHLPSSQTGELPTINPINSTKRYRYTYGISDRSLSSFVDGITKTDLHAQPPRTEYWSKTKHTPGEPIFVPDPARADKEDGGWLLSCVLDGEKGVSYLVCIDAETMQEVGRAEGEYAWGFGFHGTHVRDGERMHVSNGEKS